MGLAHNIEDGERTQDVHISQDVTFDSMLLTPDTLRGLQNSGFYKPSPIQLHGIPLGKCGFDLLLEAKSGTGKTAVFTVIALEQLDLAKGLQAVVLAPTREIAAQICDVVRQIGSHYEGLRVEVVMGGLSVHEDIVKFKSNKVHIVVGSPGRLRHLIHDKHIDISTVRLLVLDEADKLLEKSFLADVNYIFSLLPKQKQVIMSSATYTESTKTFIKQYVLSAQHICPDSNSILLGVTQKLTVVKYNINIVKQTQHRFEELLKILSKHAFKQCLIFCNYQARVGELHKMLKRHEWPAEQLYGQQEQLERLDALKSLQEYKCRILISTDLAARGIDASNVDLVINFEPPYEWQTYLHRIGRAGRFGSYGIAITILSKGREEQKFQDILKTIKSPTDFTNLWDEENGQLTIDDAVETSSISQLSEPSMAESALMDVEKTEKLWGLLSNDLKENEGNIEVFENLCSSFNVQAESFYDLLSSCEGHNVGNGTNNLYPHLKMQHMIPEYIKNTMPTTKETKLNNKTNCIRDVQMETNNNFKDTLKIKEECDIENNKKIIDYSKNKTIHVRNRKEVNDSSHEYENANISQSLLNAGLPTAFGKQKAIGKEVKYKYHSFVPNYQSNDPIYDNTERKNRNRLSYRDTEDSDTSQGFYNKRTEKSSIKSKSGNKLKKHLSKPVTESGYDVDDENYENGYNTASKQTYKTGKHRKYRNASNIETDFLHETCDSSEEDSYSAKNTNYINWYNDLKARVKQVEYAIYIEEMCKPQ